MFINNKFFKVDVIYKKISYWKVYHPCHYKERRRGNEKEIINGTEKINTIPMYQDTNLDYYKVDNNSV